jgi:hypothetical protein
LKIGGYEAKGQRLSKRLAEQAKSFIHPRISRFGESNAVSHPPPTPHLRTPKKTPGSFGTEGMEMFCKSLLHQTEPAFNESQDNDHLPTKHQSEP